MDEDDDRQADGRVTRRTLGRRTAAAVPALVGGGLLAQLVAARPADAAPASWLLGGNTATGPAALLGTTDNKPLRLATRGKEQARLTPIGNLGVGTQAPTAKVHGVAATGTAGRFEHTDGTDAAPALLARSASSDGCALLAQSTTTTPFRGSAVRGYAPGGDGGRIHPSGAFWDAAGEFSGLNGLIGAAGTGVSDGYGVIGVANNALGVGVYAQGTGGAKALVSNGNADVYGTLTKFAGSFRIDHPLAPATRYLSHSFVESPDMKNVYDGIAVADAQGGATVQLPDWFEALNRDVRYQLTALDGPAPELHVASRVRGGRFRIAGARPGQEVSWQLTGIRRDAWAEAHRIPVEHDKPVAERGRYLSPELFGAPQDAQIGGRQR